MRPLPDEATQLLADLSDERRYDLELRIWKTENKAHLLVAKLSTPSADERKRLEEQLHAMARELVELDIQVLELKAEQLDKELGEVKDELSRAKESTDKQVKDRYQGLIDKTRRPQK